MSYWQDDSSLSVQMDKAHRQIMEGYNRRQEWEQLRADILQECAKMIETRVNL